MSYFGLYAEMKLHVFPLVDVYRVQTKLLGAMTNADTEQGSSAYYSTGRLSVHCSIHKLKSCAVRLCSVATHAVQTGRKAQFVES